ncbi:MAG: penicillin-binding transpeptidase domain-containing protein [Phycisphaerae bacterium]
MFERRLKIVLTFVFCFTAILVLRAGFLQLVQADHWSQLAAETLMQRELVEVKRGRLLDYRGREIAVDVPCIDACVDYRFITDPPDEKFLYGYARSRARQLPGYYEAGGEAQARMVQEQIEQTKLDLEMMWQTLARLSGQTVNDIDQTRDDIVAKVEMRQKHRMYARFENAVAEHESAGKPPWYRKWLMGELPQAPTLSDFDEPVVEQLQSHPVLRAVDQDTYNYLAKHIDKFPGLELRPGVTRHYPYGDAAAHVIGRLSKVMRDDLLNDPNADDPLRQYYPNDLIGRSGLEGIYEETLRGIRGRIERATNRERTRLGQLDGTTGTDVRVSIDIELTKRLQKAFTQVLYPVPVTEQNPTGGYVRQEMPGAAVVIDVETGQIRAMVSHPSYDLNTFERNYEQLATDELLRPLMNRATLSSLEPGSTVKTLVGLGAIADGHIHTRGEGGTIECTGYLVLDGRKYRIGRCWVASMFETQLDSVAHHPIPYNAAHPTGHLTFADSLERSCNIYFETMADEMGIDGLSKWYRLFGLGEPTGIGLPERAGRVPDGYTGPASQARSMVWFSGIGQAEVNATPVQMANAVTTVARDGIWMRPTFDAEPRSPGQELLRPTEEGQRPWRDDLNIPPEAIEAAREGMIAVINGPAGTGHLWQRSGPNKETPPLLIAGKTGTAQAAPLTYTLRDEHGQVVLDETGRPVRRKLPLGTYEEPNPRLPWYRGYGDEQTKISHAWFIGFAPADDPKIAFAVLVEYGGSGGKAAGSVARQIIDACVDLGYLTPQETLAIPEAHYLTRASTQP